MPTAGAEYRIDARLATESAALETSGVRDLDRVGVDTAMTDGQDLVPRGKSDYDRTHAAVKAAGIRLWG